MSWIITPSQKMDLDAALYLSRVEEVEGQALEPSVRDAINSFVVGCKADGIWTAIKACCILAGARTLAGALVPLVGPAPTNLNFVNADYNRKTGLLSDGTKYLSSNRANNADPQNSNHNAVFVTAAATNSGVYMGSAVNVVTNLLAPSAARNRSTTSSSGTGSVTGYLAMDRSQAANYIVRANGTNTTNVVTSATPTADVVLVFARGTPSVPNAIINARMAFYSIGESANQALIDARITGLMNTLAGLAI